MTRPPIKSWGAFGLGILLLVAAGYSAYWQLFTIYRFWDDEGYVLISLRNFAAGGRLYTDVFSQYGPVYNLLFASLHRFLGVPLDTGGARWLTLIVWLGSTLFAFGFVRRLAASWTWGFAAGAAVFFQLRQLTHEPLHPVGLIALLLVGGLAAAGWALDAGRPALAATAAAAAGVLLALVKINVGLFYLAGIGVYVGWSTRGLLSQTWARLALAFAATAAGAVLMRPLLAEAWVIRFLLVYVIAATTTLTAVALVLQERRDASELLRPAFLSAVVVLFASIGVALASGISGSALLQGVVTAPLRQPTSFSFPFHWSHFTVPVLCLNAVGFGLWLVLRLRAKDWAERVVAVSRAVVSAGFFISFFHGFAVSVENYLLSYGVGFLWALVIPLVPASRARAQTTAIAGLLALFQVLHAFPVAGTQVNLGTLPLVLVLLLASVDLTTWLQLRWPTAARGVAAAAVAFPLWGCLQLSLQADRNYRHQPPEQFSGAQLHLSAWQTSTFNTLVANARAHGDLLFSLPGLFSFNLWTGLPTPTTQNITHWWSLLDEAQQSQIADRLGQAERPVIIVQRGLITSGLASISYRPSGLTRFIETHFEKIFSLDTYEFWVRRGRPVQPLGIARWNSDTSFDFYAPAAALPVDHLERLDYQSPAPAETIPVGKFTLVTASVPNERLTKWTCTLSGGLPHDTLDAIRFLDASGRLVSEARFERSGPQMNPQ